jgi:hypothetical protein
VTARDAVAESYETFHELIVGATVAVLSLPEALDAAEVPIAFVAVTVKV